MKLFLTILATLAIAESAFAAECAGSGFYPDPTSCSAYKQCTNGVLVKNICPAGLNWNALGGYCDWPENAGCKLGEVVQPQPTTTTQAPVVPEKTTTAPPKTTTTTTTTTKAPTGPSDALVSASEFQAAAATKGGNPDASYYSGFINSLPKAGITTRREAVLFLAHATWETVGFIYTKEVYCQSNLQACLNAYPNNQGGLAGKVYYGRGMMQLTWDYNYKAASTYLYGDDRLIQNPDQVGENPAVGWETAAWYWHANVHQRAQSFGSTLKAINGALECEGGSHQQNRYLRFMHYKQILQALGIPMPSDDDGWCTAW